MPKKKTWIWDGKPVSKTSFYRHQAEARAQANWPKLGKGKRNQKSMEPLANLREVAPPQNLYTAAHPEEVESAIRRKFPEDQPGSAEPLLSEVDVALLREFALLARGYVNNIPPGIPVGVAPLTFAAIVRLVTREGY